MKENIIYKNIYKKSAESLVNEIKKRLKTGNFVIAIDGPCASGKSSLASYLATIFDASIIEIDDFFLPFFRKTKERLEEPGGNIDYERFLKEVVLKIKNNQPISYQPYDCQIDAMIDEVTITQKPLTIIEGVYSHKEEFWPAYDIKVFLEVDEKEQILRLTNRNKDMVARFIEDWIPMEDLYFSTFKIKKDADFIIKT